MEIRAVTRKSGPRLANQGCDSQIGAATRKSGLRLKNRGRDAHLGDYVQTGVANCQRNSNATSTQLSCHTFIFPTFHLSPRMALIFRISCLSSNNAFVLPTTHLPSLYNKADRHKSRAPSLQRRTDRPTDPPTDRAAYRVACTRLKKRSEM